MDVISERDGFVIRMARKEDMEPYYKHNYCPLDPEVARLTGCKEEFTKEEIYDFFARSLEEDGRYFFLIIGPDENIIGECVINEVNRKLRYSDFRIAIYHSTERQKGIGTWATETVRDFAFEELGLHRLELEVYSFNPRAERVYLKAGFRREGVLRDAVKDGDRYADVILMAQLEEEWRAQKRQKE